MSKYFETPEIDVNIERLDSDIIYEHLRNSTIVLQDILKDKEDFDNCDDEPLSDGDDSNDDCHHMCQSCGKIYKSPGTLHAHCLLMHPKNAEEGQCVECDKKYPSMLSLQKHIRYMHRYTHRCKACYRTFPTSELLVDHGKTCSKIETPCSQCGKIFDSQLAVRNHIKYKHPERRNHWCEVCRRTFTTHRGLMNHNATVHPPGATSCVWCLKTFNSVTALQSHILYKHTEDGSKCVQCHKVFARKICLLKHLVKKHQYNIANNADDSRIGISSEDNKNVC